MAASFTRRDYDRYKGKIDSAKTMCIDGASGARKECESFTKVAFKDKNDCESHARG